jgi:glucosamine-6-phosphate deaminase
MNTSIHSDAGIANQAAANLLMGWLSSETTKNVMVAAGNTPLELYRLIGQRVGSAEGAAMKRLKIFMLDEYLGVPMAEERNCGNLLRRSVVEPWGIPTDNYFRVTSVPSDALESVRLHERRIQDAGGLDVIILGLGQNGHLGFNEPGSAEESLGRLVDLQPISIEANRKWFDGDYAPNQGVTVGLRTILGARHVLVLAYGPHKAKAVAAMVEGPRSSECPASFLQGHPDANLFLDMDAAAGLRRK